MNVPKRLPPLFLMAPLLAILAACVESKQPLSDEKTSKIDERLIGAWQDDSMMVWRVKKARRHEERAGRGGKRRQWHAPGSAVHHHRQGKAIPELQRFSKETQKDRKGAYDIYQYRFLDNNTLEGRGMDRDVLQKAIADEKLAGIIDKDNGPIITDTPEGMARYLEAHADECYPVKTDSMLTFKRQK